MAEPRRLSRGKRLLFTALVSLAALAMVELGLRLYFAHLVGPRILAYGTTGYRSQHGWQDPDPQAMDRNRDFLSKRAANHSIFAHTDNRGRYTKYYPNERKVTHDVDSGDVYTVHINSHGFRGREWTADKPPGLIRIVTLGASSTFGYFNADTTTYPQRLDEALRRRCPGRQFEVLNLAVPHSTAAEIRALFEAEALPLAPDFVTFYEGINDSARVVEEHPEAAASSRPLGTGLRRALANRSLLALLLDHLATKRAGTATFGQSPAQQQAIDRIRREFLSNVTEIRTACEERQIKLLVATQAASSAEGYALDATLRAARRGTSYGDEVDAIRRRQRVGQPITRTEFTLLVHHQLMADLRTWAGRSNALLVDGIAALDQHRDELLSWVHLSPEGNRLLAEAFADTILQDACPSP